jgi:hypothetical protein
MKKLSLPLIVLICSFLTQNAFSQTKKIMTGKGETTPMGAGSIFVNLGIGVGANYKGDYAGTAFGFKGSVEFGLWQAGPGVITLGPEIGGSFSNNNYYSYSSSYHSNTFVIAGRSAWHFGWDIPGLDTYGGISAGIGFHHYSYYDNNVNHNITYSQTIPVVGVFIGGSYFITPNFGFNAEAGYDITNFQVGVVLKLQ